MVVLRRGRCKQALYVYAHVSIFHVVIIRGIIPREGDGPERLYASRSTVYDIMLSERGGLTYKGDAFYCHLDCSICFCYTVSFLGNITSFPAYAAMVIERETSRPSPPP